MKYTPHIIAAIAVAVVATAALATTSNTISFELYQDNSKVDLESKLTFDNYQKVTITASEPVYWSYYSMNSVGSTTYHVPIGELLSTINIDTSTIEKHIVYWSTDKVVYNSLTIIDVVTKDVTSISFTAEDKRTPIDIRSYGISFGDTIDIGPSTYTLKLSAADYEVHWKEEIYKDGNLDKTNTSHGYTHQVSKSDESSKSVVYVSTDNENWTVLATINIEGFATSDDYDA